MLVIGTEVGGVSHKMREKQHIRGIEVDLHSAVAAVAYELVLVKKDTHPA